MLTAHAWGNSAYCPAHSFCHGVGNLDAQGGDKPWRVSWAKRIKEGKRMMQPVLEKWDCGWSSEVGRKGDGQCPTDGGTDEVRESEMGLFPLGTQFTPNYISTGQRQHQILRCCVLESLRERVEILWTHGLACHCSGMCTWHSRTAVTSPCWF